MNVRKMRGKMWLLFPVLFFAFNSYFLKEITASHGLIEKNEGGNSRRPVGNSVRQELKPAFPVPDFGPDGLKDLSREEVKRILSGEVLVFASHEESSGGRTVIQAGLMFEAPREKVWALLSATEKQKEYIPEIEELRLIEQGNGYNRMFFLVKIFGQKVSYTVIHRFEPETFSIWWELDRREPHDLRELFGYWKLYKFAEGRTLARYGSYVVPDFPVPAFIRNWLSRKNAQATLVRVKKYVEAARNYDGEKEN